MINQKIKRLRLQKGISRTEMANALNIELNTFSSIESGKTKLIDYERINIIAGVLGVELQELLTSNDTHQHFYEKVENGFASYIQTLNADNKDLVKSLQEQLNSKDKLVDNLLLQNQELLALIKRIKLD